MKRLTLFVDMIRAGDSYNGKTIMAIEPPDKMCGYWLIHLKGETVPRTIGKDSQMLIERKSE